MQCAAAPAAVQPPQQMSRTTALNPASDKEAESVPCDWCGDSVPSEFNINFDPPARVGDRIVHNACPVCVDEEIRDADPEVATMACRHSSDTTQCDTCDVLLCSKCLFEIEPGFKHDGAIYKIFCTACLDSALEEVRKRENSKNTPT